VIPSGSYQNRYSFMQLRHSTSSSAIAFVWIDDEIRRIALRAAVLVGVGHGVIVSLGRGGRYGAWRAWSR
jgi:hypothetical protein